MVFSYFLSAALVLRLSYTLHYSDGMVDIYAHMGTTDSSYYSLQGLIVFLF